MKTYFKPIGLVFGPDARAMISAGAAGALGGTAHIGFTSVERILRDGATIERSFLNYNDVHNHPAIAAITRARPSLGPLALDRVRVMGVVNVTPDSFSDGGKFSDTERAVAHGLSLEADILDVGGESTRPGSMAVDVDEELARVVPVIAGLAAAGHLVSLDTRKSDVMRAGLKAGASIINDVSALSYDPSALTLIAETNTPIILMHAQGDPRTMQLNPTYDDVALDVYDYLEQRIAACVAAGISLSNICIDPGIGFGKNFNHNLAIMNALTLFHGLGVGLLVGLSRKAFVGALTGEKLAANRVHGSVSGALHVAMNGCHIVRVHDVKATIESLAVFQSANDPDLADF
jgi:dihydropteroate synthase